MTGPILLTAFAPWRAHQRSNSSDDLLALVTQHPHCPSNVVVMRGLPVHFDLAPVQVLAQAMALRPALVVCCGMAETRPLLTLEQWGRRGDRRLRTRLDLDALSRHLALTAISQDAGDYVCNHLYYDLLATLPQRLPSCQGLFIHVPKLHHHLQPWLLLDFLTVLARLGAMVPGNQAATLTDAQPRQPGGNQSPPDNRGHEKAPPSAGLKTLRFRTPVGQASPDLTATAHRK
jgi:pyroglutamyl-peptidase